MAAWLQEAARQHLYHFVGMGVPEQLTHFRVDVEIHRGENSADFIPEAAE